MTASTEVGMVLAYAHRDRHMLGECDRMLASPDLFQEFVRKIEHQSSVLGNMPSSVVQLFFVGTPVVECQSLEGFEYAFVRKAIVSTRD